MERPFRTARPLSELLLDNILYWLVSKIRARARRLGDFPHMSVQADDLIGVRIISTGRFELTQLDAVRYILTNPVNETGIPGMGGIFIDIGANVGVYSVGLSEFFSKVFAFEPHPVAFKLLEANVVLNDITNATCVQMAVSDKTGQASLYVPKTLQTGWSTLNHDHIIDRREKSLAVNVDSLDNIAETYAFADRPISLIKIDVEGHESQVLRGSKKILSRSGPMVLFEVLDTDHGKESISILRECGYASFYRFSRGFTARKQGLARYVDGLVHGLPVNIHRVDPSNPVTSALICAVRDPIKPEGFAEPRRMFNDQTVP